MHNLFVYGTLQNNEIVQAITGKTFRKIPFILSVYKVLLVKDTHFPGMIENSSSEGDGYILLDLDEDSFMAINKWEGSSYMPKSVTVRLDGKSLGLVAYIWKDNARLEGKWDNNLYRSSHMQECIQVCIPNELAR